MDDAQAVITTESDSSCDIEVTANIAANRIASMLILIDLNNNVSEFLGHDKIQSRVFCLRV